MTSGSILWFRQDLRLFDQPALRAAVKEGPVLPVYVLDDETPGDWRIGSAQRWWLHHSLNSLAADLKAKGAPPLLLKGRANEAIARLAKDMGISRVHAIAHYEPWWQKAEQRLAASVDLVLHEGQTLLPPARVTNGSGGRYRIFTPFWRALKEQMPPARPVPGPECIEAVAAPPPGDHLEDWQLRPRRPDWAKGFAIWTPGEAGARAALKAFLPEIGHYEANRDLPSREGTSRLSPHLHFGELSPATIWHLAAKQAGAGAESFLREVGWRDFSIGGADQFPQLGEENGRAGFDDFPWRPLKTEAAADDFAAWRRGRTGYPLVDAGMRQLWTTGWMHNRVRMIAASFLVKHLLIDWRHGARWFWDTLVDADYGNNSLNWQWVAGTGADSQPFYRIMAPLVQSRKFDAAGYIRQWVPELAAFSAEDIHEPWNALCPPSGYPQPIIGHQAARARAHSALDKIKNHPL